MKKHRVLLVWNGDGEEIRSCIRTIEEAGHQVVYTIVNGTEQMSVPGVVVHRDDDARIGKPAPELSNKHYAPPSSELVRALYRTESILLTMMNRKVEPAGVSLALDEKKRLYYELLTYWQGVLEEFQVSAVVFPSIPHNVSNFTIYSLAKYLGLRVILFQETTVSDRVLVQSSFDESSQKLRSRIEAHKDKDVPQDSLTHDLQLYVQSQITEEEDPTPSDVHILSERVQGLNRMYLKAGAIMHSIRDRSLPKKVAQRLKRAFGSNLKKEYERFASKPDYETPYVYVALHWQPECSTSPLGEMFADQILMIETIALGIPSNWRIYVKEHPFQWSKDGVTYFTNMRYPSYYARIASIPCVSLVPITTDTYALQKKAQMVATVTGRAALEAVFRGTPALVFGYPWFINMPGIHKVNSSSEVREVCEKVHSGYRVPLPDVVRYMKSLDESTIHGYFDFWGQQQSVLTREQSAANLINAVVQELNETKT